MPGTFYDIAADVLSKEPGVTDADINELAGDLADYAAGWLEAYRKDKAWQAIHVEQRNRLRAAMDRFYSSIGR